MRFQRLTAVLRTLMSHDLLQPLSVASLAAEVEGGTAWCALVRSRGSTDRLSTRGSRALNRAIDIPSVTAPADADDSPTAWTLEHPVRLAQSLSLLLPAAAEHQVLRGDEVSR